MNLLPASMSGHVKIEVEIEIEDDECCVNKHTHRCSFFVNSELGLIENFGRQLEKIKSDDIGTRVLLNELDDKYD